MTEAEIAPVSLLPVVACALVDQNGRVLIQQRLAGTEMAGLWEFPGGKIEPGETPEDALARELRDELGVEIAQDDLIAVTFASAPIGNRHLVLLLYMSRVWQGEPRALQASALRWLRPVALQGLAMPPADVPLVAALSLIL